MQGALVVLAQHMEREHEFTLISLVVTRAYNDPGASPNWPTYHEPRPVPELDAIAAQEAEQGQYERVHRDAPVLDRNYRTRGRRPLDADGVPIERTIPGGFGRATQDDL